MDDGAAGGRPSLADVLREWGRIGCLGFGGPPTHIRLLRQLCVERRQWIEATEFEDAVAACNLLPGPASTQLAIFCAWRVRGRPGALLGGAAFIVPGLALILALAAVFLAGAPPRWVWGTGAGAGAAVPAVAVQAAAGLIPASWGRYSRRDRWVTYLLTGTAAAALLGPWLVLALLGCGLLELTITFRGSGRGRVTTSGAGTVMVPFLAGGRRVLGQLFGGSLAGGKLAGGKLVGGSLAGPALGAGGLLAVAWVAIKVGALSYGGGFVIIPLMQADAVDHYRWMTGPQFLNAVALGQITPGPVVQTVAVVGYAAAGVLGGLLAALVAFSPSFAFVLLGAHRFARLRTDRRARAFLDGAGPAAIGAVLGSAVTLARTLSVPWQFAVLVAAAIALLPLRRGVVTTLTSAGLVGALVALAGGPLPH
jgi:chromate transporter